MTDNRLLIVDDDPNVAEFIGAVAGSLGYAIDHVPSIQLFDRRLVEFCPTVITLDMNLEDGDGVELLRRLGERGSEASILIISGVDARTLAMLDKLSLTRRLNVVGVLAKPVAPENLAEHLCRALRAPSVTPEMLEEALVTRKLSVHSQPRVCLCSDDRPIVGAEAFLRWKEGDGRAFQPIEFLGVARDHGLMPRLTDFVLEQALQQLSVWRAQGLEIALSVNFDPRLVDDFHFADRLLALLREYNVRPDLLTLDLQETAAIEDPDLTASVLTRLRIYDVQLALDDFGVGYSSLTQLRSLPFSEVKIASNLTQGLAVGTDSEAFIDLIIKLCRILKLRVCAEGVETWAAVEVLRASGCDDAQGYLFGHPMAASDFVQWFRHWDGQAVEISLTG
jgi:EAL domain-containing protein (putative c-di-GMP-specific phosphodiesterase class I)